MFALCWFSLFVLLALFVFLCCFLFATIPGIILTGWRRDCKYFPLSLRRPSVSIRSLMAREQKNNTLLDDLNMESIQRVLPIWRNCWETSSHVKHIINSGAREFPFRAPVLTQRS